MSTMPYFGQSMALYNVHIKCLLVTLFFISAEYIKKT